MPDVVVRVYEFAKVFRVPERDPGLRASLKSLVKRRTLQVPAVAGVSFEIQRGEIVGRHRICAVLFVATRLFWRFALGHYSGASA